MRETNVAHSKREVKKVKGGQQISHAQARKQTQNEHAHAQTKAQTKHVQIEVEQKINEVAHELYPRERNSKINSDIRPPENDNWKHGLLSQGREVFEICSKSGSKKSCAGKVQREDGEIWQGR